MQQKAAVALGRLALEEVATIPLGQFLVRTAYRSNLSGMLPGSAPYPWGLRRSCIAMAEGADAPRH